MEKRSARKVLFLFLMATGIIATAVLMGIVLGFMMPIIYQALLPVPSDWLP